MSTDAAAQRTFRTARSVLSVPAHDEHKVTRARLRGADLIMWDLEDSVPLNRKGVARSLIARFAQVGDCVRVNATNTVDFRHDMKLADGLGLLVMVPKVELSDLSRVPNRCCILSIESPSAVLSAQRIAAASCGIAFGRYDFMACCGIASIWSPLIDHAMQQVALAAFAAGVVVSDAPCYDLTGGGLLEAEIARATACGFSSKCCIHPSQIAACAAFGRSSAELANAASIVASWNDNTPIAVVGTSMVGPPDLRRAETILARSAQ